MSARWHALLALAGLLAVVTVPVAAQDQASPPAFGIKEDHDLPRTRIRNTVVTGSVVPVNQRYEQMSDEHKALVRSQYDSRAADDDPPFPAEGLEPVYQALYRVQRALLVKGELTLVATVLPDGTVSQVQAIGSPDPQLTKYAGAVVMATPFKPALCHGQPCQMEFPFRMHFVVR